MAPLVQRDGSTSYVDCHYDQGKIFNCVVDQVTSVGGQTNTDVIGFSSDLDETIVISDSVCDLIIYNGFCESDASDTVYSRTRTLERVTKFGNRFCDNGHETGSLSRGLEFSLNFSDVRPCHPILPIERISECDGECVTSERCAAGGHISSNKHSDIQIYGMKGDEMCYVSNTFRIDINCDDDNSRGDIPATDIRNGQQHSRRDTCNDSHEVDTMVVGLHGMRNFVDNDDFGFSNGVHQHEGNHERDDDLRNQMHGSKKITNGNRVVWKDIIGDSVSSVLCASDSNRGNDSKECRNSYDRENTYVRDESHNRHIPDKIEYSIIDDVYEDDNVSDVYGDVHDNESHQDTNNLYDLQDIHEHAFYRDTFIDQVARDDACLDNYSLHVCGDSELCLNCDNIRTISSTDCNNTSRDPVAYNSKTSYSYDDRFHIANELPASKLQNSKFSDNSASILDNSVHSANRNVQDYCKDDNRYRTQISNGHSDMTCGIQTIDERDSSSLQNILNEQTKLLAFMASAISSSTLPQLEIQRFDGNIMDFHKFMCCFDTVVDSASMDDALKLRYLIQFCDGIAKEAIEDCVMLDCNVGYTEARQILKTMFGNPYSISYELIDMLTSGPLIEPDDLDGLVKLAVVLNKCEIILGKLGRESDINSQTLVLIVRRLPLDLREKWAEEAYDIFETGSEPRLRDIKDFVNKCSRIIGNIFGQDYTKSSRDNESDNIFQAQGFHAYNVPLADNDKTICSQSVVHDTGNVEAMYGYESECFFCANKHSIEYCPEFEQLTVDRRFKYIKDHNLCFVCLKSGHSARFCAKQARCDSDKCTRNHHALLHRDFVYDNRNIMRRIATEHEHSWTERDAVMNNSVYGTIFV